MSLLQATGIDLDPPRWLTFMLVLAVGVAVSGFANFALSQAGYGGLGAYVWAVGYAGTVLLLFIIYLRPLEITGPDGEDGAEPDR
jgi:hypothetical protein